MLSVVFADKIICDEEMIAMSMIGYYYQADDITVQKLRKGADSGFAFGKQDEKNMLCVDKAWHAIHFILAGEAWEVSKDEPVSQAVLGGEPVNDDDMGYGPMRLIPKELVSQIADALDEMDESDFRGKFNLSDMMEEQIYPLMDNEDEEQFFEYVWEMFVELQKFYRDAAEKNHNVLAFIA